MAINPAQLIARHPLDNGLTLEFWDHSRPVAGDRWLVVLETRIAVPVRADTLPPELQGQAAAVAEALGEEIVFSHRDERNFIAPTEVSAILNDMQDRGLAMAPRYFGHADFAAGFIRKTYADHQERRGQQNLSTLAGKAP
jgi:hypothetical protein